MFVILVYRFGMRLFFTLLAEQVKGNTKGLATLYPYKGLSAWWVDIP